MKDAPFIFVMEAGFVLIGRVSESTTTTKTLYDCGVIRLWGTKQGLGELAAKGIQKETIIDPEPDGSEINTLYMMRMIPCDAKAWDSFKGMK
jgi:hypothetical protein